MNHFNFVLALTSANNAQEWPRQVMICTRTVCDMGWLKNFFQNLPNVSVVDYTDGVEVDSNWRGKHLELRAPKSSAGGNAILRCYPDLRFCIDLGPYDASFRTELGEGKWVSTQIFFRGDRRWTQTALSRVIARASM